MYEAGRCVSQDLSEAARRFEIAAQAGYAEAQYALAVMLRKGRGRIRDDVQILIWLKRSAAQNYPSAMVALHSLESL